MPESNENYSLDDIMNEVKLMSKKFDDLHMRFDLNDSLTTSLANRNLLAFIREVAGLAILLSYGCAFLVIAFFYMNSVWTGPTCAGMEVIIVFVGGIHYTTMLIRRTKYVATIGGK